MKVLLIPFVLISMLNGCFSGSVSEPEGKRIIFFGDSITELGVQQGGYVSILRDSLNAMGYSYEIIGAGVSGNKITDLLTRADKDVLSRKPFLVVVYIGINDVWHHEFTQRGHSGTPKEMFDRGLRELIARIQSAGSKIILCTPSVIGEKADGSNKYDSMLDEYSGIARAAAKDLNVPLCDLRKVFLDQLIQNNPGNKEKDIFTYDGVHLNDRGNHLVAMTLLRTFDGLGLFFPMR